MPPGPAAGRGRLGSGGRLRRPGRSGPLANLAGCRGRRGPRSPTRGGCGRHRQLRPLRGDRDLHASRGPGVAPVHRAVQRAVMPAAWGGIAPLLSTLPPAFGIAQGDRRVMVDMATTSVARGTTAAYAGRDQPLQAGWALDAQGEPPWMRTPPFRNAGADGWRQGFRTRPRRGDAHRRLGALFDSAESTGGHLPGSRRRDPDDRRARSSRSTTSLPPTWSVSRRYGGARFLGRDLTRKLSWVAGPGLSPGW